MTPSKGIAISAQEGSELNQVPTTCIRQKIEITDTSGLRDARRRFCGIPARGLANGEGEFQSAAAKRKCFRTDLQKFELVILAVARIRDRKKCPGGDPSSTELEV
jgi:hypothetical protein